MPPSTTPKPEITQEGHKARRQEQIRHGQRLIEVLDRLEREDLEARRTSASRLNS